MAAANYHALPSDSTRVLAAMSGGVDSSTAALVLLGRGLEVVGATMKLARAHSDDSGEHIDASGNEVEAARLICASLGIAHVVYDFTAEFEAKVIERFCEAYLGGQTPNPCIECNRHFKFAALHEKRAKGGFDYLATGHYVRCAYNEQTGRFELARAVDLGKDQSYFLYHLSQEVLSRTLFPLGDLMKPEVRALAEAKGLASAHASESQDICFIPDGDYARFIEQRMGGDGPTRGLPGDGAQAHAALQPGPILDCEGHELGKHRGLMHYTIGQRKGIGVAHREPLYVFAKDLKRNALIVDTDARTRTEAIECGAVNFVARASLATPAWLQVKTHYRQRPVPALVEQLDERRMRVTFEEPSRACAPGQAAVVYDGDIVVCGGTIERNLS